MSVHYTQHTCHDSKYSGCLMYVKVSFKAGVSLISFHLNSLVDTRHVRSPALWHEELFAELLRTFFTQLSQAPSDLFGDDLTKDNFMGSCALSLLEICNTDAPKLQKRCAKLRELVEEKFGLSTEDLALLGPDAPQMVDLQGHDLITEDAMGAMDWWTGFAPTVLSSKSAADSRQEESLNCMGNHSEWYGI